MKLFLLIALLLGCGSPAGTSSGNPAASGAGSERANPAGVGTGNGAQDTSGRQQQATGSGGIEADYETAKVPEYNRAPVNYVDYLTDSELGVYDKVLSDFAQLSFTNNGKKFTVDAENKGITNIQQETQAIVNPSNTGMVYGANAAAAISKAVGPEATQQSSDKGAKLTKYSDNNLYVVDGKIPVGKAGWSDAGNLSGKVQAIIHQVAIRGNDIYKDLYFSTISALELANDKGWDQPDFTLAGTGVGGAKVDQASEIMLRAFVNFFKAHSENGTLKLTGVRISLYDPSKYETFKIELEKIRDLEKQNVTIGHNPDNQLEEPALLFEEPDQFAQEHAILYIPSGIKLVVIKKGLMDDVSTNGAIVISGSPDMHVSENGLGRQIRNHYGNDVIDGILVANGTQALYIDVIEPFPEQGAYKSDGFYYQGEIEVGMSGISAYHNVPKQPLIHQVVTTVAGDTKLYDNIYMSTSSALFAVHHHHNGDPDHSGTPTKIDRPIFQLAGAGVTGADVKKVSQAFVEGMIYFTDNRPRGASITEIHIAIPEEDKFNIFKNVMEETAQKYRDEEAEEMFGLGDGNLN